MMNEYLEILELSDGELTISEVERKFKNLAKNYHPDINPDENALNKMKKLIEARDKIKDFLQYSIVTKTYKTSHEAYNALKDDLFKLIERKFKIIDGYELCKNIWQSLEFYDNELRDKPDFGVKGGFTRFFLHCGLIERIANERNNKYIYKKNTCSITSAKKLIKILDAHNFIEFIQKGRGINSRLRIIINHNEIAKFIINNSKTVGYKLQIIESTVK
jgi:hypothetical protein